MNGVQILDIILIILYYILMKDIQVVGRCGAPNKRSELLRMSQWKHRFIVTLGKFLYEIYELKKEDIYGDKR